MACDSRRAVESSCYDPGYQLSGTAAQLDRHGIRALGLDLLQAQRDCLTTIDSSVDCGAKYDYQLIEDARWEVGQADVFVVTSQDQSREQWEQAHRQQYQPNGGELSFEDWLSEGMPEDDRIFSVSRSESPIWRGFTNFRSGIRTSGAGRNRRYYEWDNTHNDIEVYDRRGNYLGSMHPVTGEMYKSAVPGRTISI